MKAAPKRQPPVGLIVGNSLNYITARNNNIRTRSINALIKLLEQQPNRGKRAEFITACLTENTAASRMNLPLWTVYFSLIYDSLLSKRDGTFDGYTEAIVACLDELTGQYCAHAEMILIQAAAGIQRQNENNE
jgi:hypothetical protein